MKEIEEQGVSLGSNKNANVVGETSNLLKRDKKATIIILLSVVSICLLFITSYYFLKSQQIISKNVESELVGQNNLQAGLSNKTDSGTSRVIQSSSIYSIEWRGGEKEEAVLYLDGQEKDVFTLRYKPLAAWVNNDNGDLVIITSRDDTTSSPHVLNLWDGGSVANMVYHTSLYLYKRLNPTKIRSLVDSGEWTSGETSTGESPTEDITFSPNDNFLFMREYSDTGFRGKVLNIEKGRIVESDLAVTNKDMYWSQDSRCFIQIGNNYQNVIGRIDGDDIRFDYIYQLGVNIRDLEVYWSTQDCKGYAFMIADEYGQYETNMDKQYYVSFGFNKEKSISFLDSKPSLSGYSKAFQVDQDNIFYTLLD